MRFWVFWLLLLVAVGALADSQTPEQEAPAPAPAVVTEPAPAPVQAPVEPVEAQRAQAEQTWVPVRVAARNLSVISLQAIPLVALLGAVGWAIRRRNVWFPRKEDGAMPFRGIDNRTSREALDAWHEAQLAEASQVLPVHTYAPHTTYAPHDTYSPRNHQSGQWAEPTATVTVSVDKAPTFAELVAAGTIGPGQPLYLGMSAQGALTGTWKSVYSSGIGGVQGSGKTWTGISLALQSLAAGANVMVVDPHHGDPESLGARLQPVARLLGAPVASDAADIRRLLGKVRAELARRAGGGTDRRLWLLVVDEYTALQRGELGEEITATIEAVTQEGRKLAIICLLLGQRWSATRSGGGDLRNTLTSAFVHRMRPEDARMLTGMRADQLPRDTLQLAPGECYVLDTSGDFTRVVTPRLTDADVAAFAALLTRSATSSRPVPDQFPTSSTGSIGTGHTHQFRISSATSSDDEHAGQDANDPQYAEVRAWVLEGVSYAQIKARLVGEHVKRGRASQDADQRLTAILQAIAMEALYAHGDPASG